MSLCSICGKPYEEYGNNAQPVNDGKCCDVCNATIVIPRRIQDRNNIRREQEIINENKNRGDRI